MSLPLSQGRNTHLGYFSVFDEYNIHEHISYRKVIQLNISRPPCNTFSSSSLWQDDLQFLKQSSFFFFIIVLNIYNAMISVPHWRVACVCFFFFPQSHLHKPGPVFPPAASSSPLVGGVLFSLADRELREISSPIESCLFSSQPPVSRSPGKTKHENIKPIFETVPRFCEPFKCAISIHLLPLSC